MILYFLSQMAEAVTKHVYVYHNMIYQGNKQYAASIQSAFIKRLEGNRDRQRDLLPLQVFADG
jgi:hypothetical protein